MKNRTLFTMGTLALAVAGVLGTYTLGTQATGKSTLKAPKYVVDATFPKPFKQEWVTGEVAGTCIDSNDHVFIVTRGFQTGGLVSPENLTAMASPPVIEFDRKGNVVNSWGDPSLNTTTQGTLAPGTNKVLPNGIHGCYVDYQDNVWIGGNGDGVVQKYSHSGQLLMQIGEKGLCDSATGACGTPGDGNSSTTRLNQPADIAVDPKNGDVYIADGYGNHRVVVFDKNGTYLRQWGSAGTGPGQFSPGGGGHPHCVVLGNDNLVYACDRANDRIHVFNKQGVLQRTIAVVPGTGTGGAGTAGSAWDLDFSQDKNQKMFFEADGGNETLWTFDKVAGVIIGGLGQTGHQAGQFTFLHTVSVDSKGNIYTGETIGGRRIQKFVPGEGDD